MTGTVTGAAAGGSVDVYREQRSARTLVATVPLAADGSFAATDPAWTSTSVYRAVYRDPVTGLPVAALLRTPPPAG